MPDVYEVVPVEDHTIWDAFVTQAIGGTVFSTYAWLDCAAQTLGGQVKLYGCFKNGHLLAGLSGLEQKRSGFNFLRTPDLTPHGGLLCAPVISKGPAKREAERSRATRLLLTHLHELYDYFFLVQAPAITDIREFSWTDWKIGTRYSYQLDLSDLGALWERVERRTRTVIRKAEKLNFDVLPTTDWNLLKRYYELIYAQQEGNDIPVDPEIVRDFTARAAERNLIEAYKAESPTGEVASVVVFVRGFDTVYAWLNGKDPALNSTGAESLLYWRYFARTEYQKFDFVGANMPAIAKFKRGFGGDLVPYFITERYRNQLVKAAHVGHRKVRQWL